MLYHQLAASSAAVHDFADLRAVVDVAVQTHEREVVVGLDSIESLDDAVIRELIRALRRIREIGGAVCLDTTRASVCDTLHDTGLDRVFPIVSPV
ncbi:MAG: STAS domain-containing protein [Polyangiaceae bacterium]